jgi:hypothetical protein
MTTTTCWNCKGPCSPPPRGGKQVYCSAPCRSEYRKHLAYLRRQVEWRASLVAESERQLEAVALRDNATRALVFRRQFLVEAEAVLAEALEGRA